jgi:hypothetical protein
MEGLGSDRTDRGADRGMVKSVEYNCLVLLHQIGLLIELNRARKSTKRKRKKRESTEERIT